MTIGGVASPGIDVNGPGRQRLDTQGSGHTDSSQVALSLKTTAPDEIRPVDDGVSGAKTDGYSPQDTAAGGLKSFTYGALGMDHPDSLENKEDTSYTSGQYLKAAATLGSIIALFV